MSLQESPQWTHSPGEQVSLGNKVIGDSLQLQMSMVLWLITPSAGLSPDDNRSDMNLQESIWER